MIHDNDSQDPNMLRWKAVGEVLGLELAGWSQDYCAQFNYKDRSSYNGDRTIIIDREIGLRLLEISGKLSNLRDRHYWNAVR